MLHHDIMPRPRALLRSYLLSSLIDQPTEMDVSLFHRSWGVGHIQHLGGQIWLCILWIPLFTLAEREQQENRNLLVPPILPHTHVSWATIAPKIPSFCTTKLLAKICHETVVELRPEAVCVAS